jgi:cytochrome bd ubiquinol oxidase subunit II
VLAYIVLDGFDLGLGTLFAVERTPDDRDLMVDTVAPVWDGNETWLVLGGASLYGVFPVAYRTILPALYPPIVAMLLALIFRGVAFEFRPRAETRSSRSAWDMAFCAGSLVAALMQGIILGALIQGIKVENNEYAGGGGTGSPASAYFAGLPGRPGTRCWVLAGSSGARKANCSTVRGAMRGRWRLSSSV